MKELYPTEKDVGLRLDRWVSSLYPSIPRTSIQRLIATGTWITIRGKACNKADRVSLNEVYSISNEPELQQLSPNPILPTPTLLYEDEALFAISKSAGMNCQPNQSDENDTLANALLVRWPNLLGVGDGPLTCGILHRIDRDTSGLVLVAKTQAVYDALREQFSNHAITKHYTALVSGKLTAPGHLENEIAHNPRCPGRMVDASIWHDAKRPMHAVTDYVPIRSFTLYGSIFTLLDVTILTGVTHQIRAQLSFAGIPILGDMRYGGRQLRNFDRHFLHASSVTFSHPLTQQAITLSAPLTSDLLALVPQV
ncbi:MAG: RluA family pseudouridine synthase [Kiritimatiellia bacterium]